MANNNDVDRRTSKKIKERNFWGKRDAYANKK